MKYNKLVRDKIPEYIKSKGGKPIIHIAGEKEYGEKLREKLTEEVNEYLEDENMEELADILEVIDAICEHKHFTKNEIEKIKNKKFKDRGGFKEKIILDEG